MPKNNKDPINPEDIKAWEDFKGKKFLEGDKGEIFKKPIKENKKQDQIDFKIDLHGYSLQESFEKIRSVIENCYKKDSFYTVKTRFVSEIISCVKDANNNIIEGSSDEIQTVNDVWCFSKDLNSDDPTWLLTEIAQDVHAKE